ncbi:MAG TPA: cytochrome C oxidase subunit IV family protein [Polyangiaceae bacterium]|jgi:cytochrome c oxidase subunit 4
MAHDHDQDGSPRLADHHGDEHADDGAVHTHIASVQFYVGILGALMFLTLLTVGVASIHLGPLNLAVAIIIASLKATLVILFFMHLKYDNKFNATIVVCSLMFIGVFFAYTINDTDRRAELDDAQGSQVLPASGEQAPGGYKGSPSPYRSHEHVAALTAPGMEEQPEEISPNDVKAAGEGENVGEVQLHK